MTTFPSRKPLVALRPIALVLAGLLSGAFFADMLRPAAAFGQDAKIPPEKLLNSADQFRYMVAGINQTNERLTRIENLLSTGVKVKVTEMPPVTMKESGK